MALWNRAGHYSFIHSFIYLHSSKSIIHNKMYMQDNKAAYATLTVALYNWEIKHYCIFLPCGGFFLSFYLLSFFPRLISAVADWMYTILPHMMWPLCKCRACMWLAGNAGPKKSPKNRHLSTIAQLCRAISLQLRHISTIGKELVKQQYLLHTFSQYGELRPTSG